MLKAYGEAISDEEKLFAQKAKVTWLCKGDRNSKKFHQVMKSRKHAKKWHEEEKVVEQLFKNFQKFIGPSGDTAQIDNAKELFTTKLTENEAASMVRAVADEERK